MSLIILVFFGYVNLYENVYEGCKSSSRNVDANIQLYAMFYMHIEVILHNEADNSLSRLQYNITAEINLIM